MTKISSGKNHPVLQQPASAGSSLYVQTLAVSGNTLYAGGAFSTAGGVQANNIARWNGTNWSVLGSGVSGGGQLGY